MKTLVSHSNWHQRAACFAGNRDATSAVEFALVLPLMLTLYLGSVEVLQGIAIDHKVTLTTRTMADLASQVSSITTSEMTALLNASASVIAPYDQSKLKVVLSAVSIDGNGVAKIVWSDTLNGTARSVGSTVTVPTALKVNFTTLIWSEVTYDYKPVVGYVLTGNLNLADQLYMRPRLSDTVTRL